MPNRINWFEIPVKDLERSAAFYSKVLDCEVVLQKDENFAVLAYAKGDVSGALVQCENHPPSVDGILIYLNAEGRLDEAIKQVRACRGTVIEDKHQIEPYGERAIVIDTEGNRVVLHST